MRFQRLAELDGNLIGELLRGDAGRRRATLDLLAVLVGACQEEGVVPQQAMAARDNVSRDRRIGVADVRARVDVVDRGGQIELLLGHELRLSLAGQPRRGPRHKTTPSKNKVEKVGKSSEPKNVSIRTTFSPSNHHKITTKNHTEIITFSQKPLQKRRSATE